MKNLVSIVAVAGMMLVACSASAGEIFVGKACTVGVCGPVCGCGVLTRMNERHTCRAERRAGRWACLSPCAIPVGACQKSAIQKGDAVQKDEAVQKGDAVQKVDCVQGAFVRQRTVIRFRGCANGSCPR